ncbi:DUF6520 family protein [Maribacter polysaccharolyticus]|uniref:DUF6520 family protein n=1 Tax=Maribacter polysaccharolyticus TaxID=3020831 RepID=UPI00237F98CA|nr:DUF6520 family protein [Maribacter polysaccharolyticus]MDE3741151.1 DUF6520 family protein [Maribacter polysaccharolyticus]
MKTKFFKFMLPALAIVMALGFAFASEAETVSRIAYYNHPILGVQSTMVENECGQGSEISCQFNGHQLYAEPALTTELRKD